MFARSWIRNPLKKESFSFQSKNVLLWRLRRQSSSSPPPRVRGRRMLRLLSLCSLQVLIRSMIVMKISFFNQMGFQLSILPPLLRLLLQEGGRAPRSPPPWGEATNITVIITTTTMASMATKTTMGLGWHLTSRISFSFRQLVVCWKL